MVALIAVLALAEPLPVATHNLEAGSLIASGDIRWVDVEDQTVIGDTWPDPAGRLVVERVLGGEPIRAERLLDTDTPERFAIPGFRAVRIKGSMKTLQRGTWADLVVAGDPPCARWAHLFVLGLGKGGDELPDSWWVQMTPEQALGFFAERRPMKLSPHQEVPACSP